MFCVDDNNNNNFLWIHHSYINQGYKNCHQFKITHTYMNIYTYATIVYYIKDTCQSSYNAFVVTYNRININSYNNKIFKNIYINIFAI
jgi:hypothetical protein